MSAQFLHALRETLEMARDELVWPRDNNALTLAMINLRIGQLTKELEAL